MNRRGYDAIASQQTLLPLFEEALEDIRDASPQRAATIQQYVWALRAECSSRRIENRELREVIRNA